MRLHGALEDIGKINQILPFASEVIIHVRVSYCLTNSVAKREISFSYIIYIYIYIVLPTNAR